MQPDSPRRKKVRSIFLSDFHMGYKGFDAKSALDFLTKHECDYLYLVGDIFDGWKLEKRWYWNDDYTRVIDEIVNMQKQGTKIFYTPGNHDEKLYDFLPFISRPLFHVTVGIRIDDHFIHRTATGKRYLVLHGHQWDNRIIRNTSKPSDRFHGLVTRLKDWMVDHAILPPQKTITIENGITKRFSLGKAIAKNGVEVLNRFTQTAALRAIEGRYDGIIYGHSHVPTCETRETITIANCGSWTSNLHRAVKGHTAIIEEENGHISLQYWPVTNNHLCTEAKPSINANDIKPTHKETRQIANWAFDLWCNNPQNAYQKASI